MHHYEFFLECDFVSRIIPEAIYILFFQSVNYHRSFQKNKEMHADLTFLPNE